MRRTHMSGPLDIAQRRSVQPSSAREQECGVPGAYPDRVEDAMRPRKREITALLYAGVFAGAAGAALYFFARASVIASILAAGVLFAVSLFALLENER
jgi:hypothetical protein